MISLAPDFAARLAAETTTLAFCWRVSRFDGVTLGFTSHDRDLDIDGLVYRSAPGIAPSAIHLSGGLQTDSMDISGALSADAITEADLTAGRSDGALRSDEHTSELQSLMRISYAVFCLKK